MSWDLVGTFSSVEGYFNIQLAGRLRASSGGSFIQEENAQLVLLSYTGGSWHSVATIHNYNIVEGEVSFALDDTYPVDVNSPMQVVVLGGQNRQGVYPAVAQFIES
jgi:hypothetical protein